MITVYTKLNCPPCEALKTYIKSLSDEDRSKFTIIGPETHSMSEIFTMLSSLGSSGFPTIVVNDRVITGFGTPTIKLLNDYLNAAN